MRIVAGALGAALALFVVAGVPGQAHHSVAAKFDEGKQMTLTGVVTMVDWRNPHAHVFLNVEGPKNELLNWAVELESTLILEASGWSRESG